MASIIWSKWYLIMNKSGAVIRRYQLGDKTSWQRYPKKEFAHLGKSELKALIARLNYEHVERKRIELDWLNKLAFFPTELIRKFQTKMVEEIPSEAVVTRNMYFLNKVFLRFFLQEMGLKSWTEINEYQSEFRQSLFGEHKIKLFDLKVSASHIQRSIQIANRFLKFMNKELKDCPLFQIELPTKAKLKHYQASFGSKERSKYVTDDDWKIIEAKVGPSIKPYVQLAYYYGLRRSEALAIDHDCIFEQNLKIVKQLNKFKNKKAVYGPLKSRTSRLTPHWFIKPEVTADIIDTIKQPMHPDTLGDIFLEDLGTFGMDYTFHDLRRTFITRALKIHLPVAVMEAVGHADIKTTMGYNQKVEIVDRPFKRTSKPKDAA